MMGVRPERRTWPGLRPRFLGLCLPPAAFSALDNACTLYGQPPQYWAGAYEKANEQSPTFHALLAWHPLAFVAGGLVWIAILVSVILLLPDTLALVASIAVTLGHTVGIATWALWRFEYPYQVCNALFLASAVALGLGIRWGWRAGPAEEYRLSLPAAVRWALVAALVAIGVYLFLWPHEP